MANRQNEISSYWVSFQVFVTVKKTGRGQSQEAETQCRPVVQVLRFQPFELSPSASYDTYWKNLESGMKLKL